MPQTDIAIVIVAYNNLYPECIQTVAEAVKRSRYKTDVIVIDNNSTKAKAEDIVPPLMPTARVFNMEYNYGMGRSTNTGTQLIDAKYYFVLNPDTKLVDPTILDACVAYLESHPDVGILAPKILNFDGTRQDTCRRFPKWHMPLIQRTSLRNTAFGKSYTEEFLMHDYDQQTERDVDWVQGSAMFVPGHLWKRLGGFDRRFWLYFEDTDLCRRVQQAGYRVRYVPHIEIHHAFGRASAQIQNIFLNIMKSRATRAHIVSWIKYEWKWNAEEPIKQLFRRNR